MGLTPSLAPSAALLFWLLAALLDGCNRAGGVLRLDNGEVKGLERSGPPGARQGKECVALVEYVAVTGNPDKFNTSPLFRGEITVVGIADDVFETDGDGGAEAILKWTFAGGESIRGKNDIFQNPEDFDFRAEISSDTQTVALAFKNISDDGGAEDAATGGEGFSVGFLGSKGVSGFSSNQTKINPDDSRKYLPVKVPDDMRLNEYTCHPNKHRSLRKEFMAQPEKARIFNGPPLLMLQYFPVELKSVPFTGGFATGFSIFTIRLINVSPKDIDLYNVELEYWFDGGDSGLYPALTNLTLSPFESHCMDAALVPFKARACNTMTTEVRRGLPDTHGAQYQVHISFTEDAGILPALDESMIARIQAMDDVQNVDDYNLSYFQAIVNITSSRLLSQMNVTADYSFVDTAIIEGPSEFPKTMVPREYERNEKFPAYLNGEIVWGSPPEAGDVKVESNISIFQCETKEFNTTHCGLRVKYCCEANDNFQVERNMNLTGETPQESTSSGSDSINWILPVLGALVAVVVIACFGLLHRQLHYRNKAPVSSSSESDDETIDVPEPQFGSFAWSIMNPDSLMLQQGKAEMAETEGKIIRKDTKFHTVPVISCADSCLLLDMGDQADYSSWDPRECRTWTGHIHWVWEDSVIPYLEDRLIRRSVTSMPPVGQVTELIGHTFKNGPLIPLDVDFKSQIHPNIGVQLGEGGFGKVYEANWRGKQVAVKVLKVDSESMHKTLEDEIKLTSKFHHKHVVKLLGACLGEKENVCLIMELVTGGNLSQRIHNRNKRKMDYLEVLELGHDIADGLSYLHPTVIHRDLKPQNVLLNKEGRPKIADFGISKFKDPTKSYLSVTQTGGTPNYMAPELFNGTRVDERCDIFSLGCILYEAITRKVPLSDLPHDNCAPLFKIIKTVAIDKRRPKIPDYVHLELADIIRQCWKDNPKSRPSARELKRRFAGLIEAEINWRKQEAIKERQWSLHADESARSVSLHNSLGLSRQLSSAASNEQRASAGQQLNWFQKWMNKVSPRGGQSNQVELISTGSDHAGSYHTPASNSDNGMFASASSIERRPLVQEDTASNPDDRKTIADGPQTGQPAGSNVLPSLTHIRRMSDHSGEEPTRGTTGRIEPRDVSTSGINEASQSVFVNYTSFGSSSSSSSSSNLDIPERAESPGLESITESPHLQDPFTGNYGHYRSRTMSCSGG